MGVHRRPFTIHCNELMPFKKIVFENKNGETLVARLDMPVDDEIQACALFAHCFTCSKNLRAVGHISSALTDRGIAVMRFDFTGLGESGGDFANTNFSSNVDDLVAAARFLAENYQAPEILIGHSLGGAAVLQAAAQVESVVAVATIGAPYDPAHVKHLLEGSIEEIERTGLAAVNLAGRSFTIKKQFLDDLEKVKVEKAIRSLRRALIVFHSPLDQTVGIENAAKIYEAAKHPKSFVSLDEADHLLTREEDSRYVGEVLAAWVRKFITTRDESKPVVEYNDHRVVAYIGTDHYQTHINASGHSIVADEPLSVGGRNLGPTPYDLLNASLGACTAMTLRMYADHKKWPLEGVKVTLKHEKVHASDCEECETKDKKIDQIERELILEGPLDEQQRKRLLEIADRCPVHRTLHNKIKVVTTLHS